MKYLKIFVTALMIMCTVTSCGENSTTKSNGTEEPQKTDSNTTSEANKVNTTETVANTEADSLNFVNTQAKELFNMIADNRSVWDREDKLEGRCNGTLVDLNFDGQPEFIVSYSSGKVAVFKMNEHEFTEWFSFLTVGDAGRIYLYTDKTGKKGWVAEIYRQEGTGYNGFDERAMSIFYFTDISVAETVKFAERQYHTETADGVISTSEYYVDGNKLTITEQQFQEYNNATFDSEEWWNMERTPENALWYYYNQEYSNFTNAISKDTSYPLIPGWDWANYTTEENELYSPHGILYPLSLIVNAYVSNDDYLKSETLRN